MPANKRCIKMPNFLQKRKLRAEFLNRKYGAPTKFAANKASRERVVFVPEKGHTSEEIEDTEFSESDDQETVEQLPAEDEGVSNEYFSTIREQSECDPGTWPFVLNESNRTFLIKEGPQKIENIEFPLDSENRHFMAANYYSEAPNNDKVLRRWLVYSCKKDKVYCFPCKLFSPKSSSIASHGFSDWQHLSSFLKEHEFSISHRKCMLSWLDAECRLTTSTATDTQALQFYNLEKQKRVKVFERLVAVTTFLASRNLAFHGSMDTFHMPDNGNFLGLLEVLAKFDPIAHEHIQNCLEKKPSALSYVDGKVQSEIISRIAESIKQRIVNSCITSKYFAIIVDGTRNVEFEEQIAVIIRFLQVKDSKIVIQERFVGLLNNDKSKVIYLSEAILNFIANLGLDIGNCRGQSYDSGSDMKRRHMRAPQRICDVNPRAFYVTSACHDLFLTLCSAAELSAEAMTLFVFIRNLFTFFSGSKQNWAVLKKYIPDLTLKQKSGTRWEAKLKSLMTLRFNLGEIYDALYDLSNTLEDNQSQFEASNLAFQIKTYPLIVCIVTWCEMLSQIHLLNKMLKNVTTDLSDTIFEMKKVCTFLDTFRESGFNDVLVTAQELAEKLTVIPHFSEPTLLKPRVNSYEYKKGDRPIMGPQNMFEVSFFNTVVDSAGHLVKERLSKMKVHCGNFRFFYDIKKLKTLSNECLLQMCQDFEAVLTDGESRDICGFDLYQEMRQLIPLVDVSLSPVQLLEYIFEKNYQESFINIVISLQILITQPIMMATKDKNFSKVQLVKTYLSKSVPDERLPDLAQISIESEIAEEIDLTLIINAFAESKGKKVLK